MTTGTRVPALGTRTLRVYDARVTGALLGMLGLVAGAVRVGDSAGSPAAQLISLLVPVVCGGAFVLGATRIPSWLLSLTTGVVALLASGTAVQHATRGGGAGGAGGSAALVLLILQAVAFRSRREAWLQFGWATAVFGAALVLEFGATAGIGSWVIQSTVLAILTGAGTWTRRSFDQLLSELQHQADHDPLTGLLNRDGLQRHTAHELRPRGDRRAHVEMSVLLLDIDHFKAINDRWGHPAGDEVLVWLSGVLRTSVSPPESAARFGGEEFLLVLPREDLVVAYDRAERLRQLIASASASIRHPVTVSVGVACGTVATTDADLGDLYRRADEALYHAKQSGRNRVEVAGGEPGTELTAAVTKDREVRRR